MTIPGLEIPAPLVRHPLPWNFSGHGTSLLDAKGATVSVAWENPPDVSWLFTAAPELAIALVTTTEALVFALERYEPGTNPEQTAAVSLALTALAKAKGEKG